MLGLALEAEVDAYLAAGAKDRDERGRALVVRSGRARSRQVLTSAGAQEALLAFCSSGRGTSFWPSGFG